MHPGEPRDPGGGPPPGAPLDPGEPRDLDRDVDPAHPYRGRRLPPTGATPGCTTAGSAAATRDCAAAAAATRGSTPPDRGPGPTATRTGRRC